MNQYFPSLTSSILNNSFLLKLVRILRQWKSSQQSMEVITTVNGSHHNSQ